MAEVIVERAYFPRRGRGEIQKIRRLFEWSLANTRGAIIAVGQAPTQDDAATAMRRHAAQLGWAKAEVERG